MPDAALIARIDALLPQTQCEKCGQPGCRPYAAAVAAGAAHNQCPPGRQQTADALAQLLQRPALPLDAKPEDTVRRVAVIREDECIGCTKCIAACPVDAIVGAALRMHTVIADHCTGCDLCLPPCPVDCIDMVETGDQRLDPVAADAARRRHDARDIRLARERQRRAERRQATAVAAPATAAAVPAAADLARLRTAVATAQRQHKEAAAALTRAERLPGTAPADLARMRARVAALREKADAAQQTLDRTRPRP